MRTSMFTEALGRIGHVEALVVGDVPPSAKAAGFAGDSLRHLDTSGRHDTMLRLVGTIRDPEERAAALRGLARPYSSRALSAPVVSEFAQVLQERTWSGVVMSRAYLMPLLEAFEGTARIPVIVDLDDDDGDLARQRARLARAKGDNGRADWLEAEADAYDALIGRAAAAVDLFTTASDQSATTIRKRLPVGDIVTVVNGVAVPQDKQSAAVNGPLLFVGNLSYGPNAEGLMHFIDEVWPLILEQKPSARLVVAGSSPADELRHRCDPPEIDLVANPLDLVPLYRSAAGSIVPLLTGSGSRIKILEAGAHGTPVVATHQGMAGLAIDPMEQLFASETDPAAFARACLECLDNRDEASARAGRLQTFVSERHDREKIIASLASTLRWAFET